MVREPAEVELDTSTACVTVYLLEEAYRPAGTRGRQKPPRQEQFEPPPRLSFPSPHVSYMCCAAMTGVSGASPAFVKEGATRPWLRPRGSGTVRAGRIAIADDESLTVRTGRKCNSIRPLKTAREAGED
ncbi:MAG: hypothetical protein ACLR7U_09645 [Ruthenibacterium lactatiformans]